MKRGIVCFALMLALFLSCSCARHVQAEAFSYKEADMYPSWNETGATHIRLQGGGAQIEGSGAFVEAGQLIIVSEGDYILSGEFTGRVIVQTTKKDKVRLVLRGATIQSAHSAAIFCQQADKLTITLAEGTENALSGGRELLIFEGDEELDAAIYSKADMVLNGTGRLQVESAYHGVLSKDDLIVTGGVLTIRSENDGLRGKDSVCVGGGEITIEVPSDGIKSNNDEDADKGYISLDGGSIVIRAGGDGVQAENWLNVTGGALHITCGENADASDSCKGLKAGGTLAVYGGEIAVNAADDALHSNANMTLAGGAYTLQSGDDALHADGDLNISGGIIDILSSYEGIEAANIVISGGEVSLYAQDDGLNAAGGADQSSMGGWRGGQDRFAAGDYSITVSGGILRVNAAGDGLDSNGSLVFSGGEVYVSGPTDNFNSALDANGDVSMTGGVVWAAGSAGMLHPVQDAQQAVAYFLADGKAGQKLTLLDGAGNVLGEWTSEKDWQALVVSLPALSADGVYSLSADGEHLADSTQEIPVRGGW